MRNWKECLNVQIFSPVSCGCLEVQGAHLWNVKSGFRQISSCSYPCTAVAHQCSTGMAQFSHWPGTGHLQTGCPCSSWPGLRVLMCPKPVWMCQRSKEDVLDVLNSNSRDRSHFYKLSPKMVEFINCREINCRRLVAENINGTETIVPFFFFFNWSCVTPADFSSAWGWQFYTGQKFIAQLPAMAGDLLLQTWYCFSE